jgi:FMNH2-dependent dimethyl sulfone monooxygenase
MIPDVDDARRGDRPGLDLATGRGLGGNVHLVGTPEQIVEWFIRLHDAGCDGMQVNFFDYLPDVWRFGEQVVPPMVQAGPRKGAE